MMHCNKVCLDVDTGSTLISRTNHDLFYTLPHFTEQGIPLCVRFCIMHESNLFCRNPHSHKFCLNIVIDIKFIAYTKEVMEEFVARAEKIHNGQVDPSVDNFLKITNDARLLGTDARLLEATAPANPDGKLNQVVENVYREYKQAEKQGIIGTQLVFSDIGTPKSSWKEEMLESDYYKRGNEFDVYNYIKTELVKKGIPAVMDSFSTNHKFLHDLFCVPVRFRTLNHIITATECRNFQIQTELVKKGIPAEEVAFVHDAKTDAQRDTLFREMRQGVKKVMIGSTDKCGTGVNVHVFIVYILHYLIQFSVRICRCCRI